MPDNPGKGTTHCNRTACQVRLPMGRRWWNRETQAYYCVFCARGINHSSQQSGLGNICALEGDSESRVPLLRAHNFPELRK